MYRLPTCLLIATLLATPRLQAAEPADVVPASTGCSIASLSVVDLPAPEYLACLRSLLGTDLLAQPQSLDSLYAALRALDQRAPTRPAAADVESLQLLVRTLEARQAMRPVDRRRVVDVLLMNGRLAEAEVAKQLVASTRSRVLPRPEPLPASTVGSTESRYWTWDTASNVLTERQIDLTKGVHVVISTRTGCHFSNELATALTQDPALSRAFREHAIWISRPDQGFDLAEMKGWDTRHPATPIVTVFDLRGWPHPEPWSTPFFYFMRDGQVVSLVRGYEPHRIGELRDGFRAIGVPGLDTGADH